MAGFCHTIVEVLLLLEYEAAYFDSLLSIFWDNLCVPYSRGRTVVWLRHYASNWQVMGSIPDGVIGIFQ
jgi:hypothetical protein